MSRTRQWVVLAVVAAAAVLAVGWFVVIAPQRSAAAAFVEQAEQQRLATQALTRQLEMLRAQAAELPAKQARLAEVDAALPQDAELPTLIRQLTASSEETGVELLAISPGTPVASGPYTQVPVSLEVSGSFFPVEQFVSALEDLPRTFAVTGFALSPKEAGKETLRLTVTGSAYTKGTPAAAAGGTTAGAAAAPAPAAGGAAAAGSDQAGPAPADGEPVSGAGGAAF